MKNKITVLLVMFLSAITSSFAQSTIKMTDVDLIIYNKENANDIEFFKKKGKDKFVEVLIDSEEDENDMIKFTVEYDDEIVSLDEIIDEEDEEYELLYVKDLKSTSKKNLLGKSFKIEENWDKEGEEKNQLVFNMLSPYFCTIQEMYFGEKQESNGGFGVYENYSSASKKEKRWRVYTNNFYQIIEVDFGNNKHIYYLAEGRNLDHVLLPLKDKNYLISDSDGISEITTTSSHTLNYHETFFRYDYEDFNVIQKNKDDKYLLKTFTNKTLIKTAYDTIVFNNFFILGKNKDGKVDIYNSYYKKIDSKNIKNIKSAYLHRSGLELITDEGASYYDADLRKIESFPRLSYGVCGTVSYTQYSISFSKKHNKYIITKENGYVSSADSEVIYVLNGIEKQDSVTFLNGKKEHYRDGNSSFVNEHYISPSFLKITKQGKSGIYHYSFNEIKRDSELSFFDTLAAEVSPKIELPIDNDSIVYKNKLVLFYKNDKVGIFSMHQTPQYQYIEKKTESFFEIKKNNKMGWLDIQTGKEYF